MVKYLGSSLEISRRNKSYKGKDKLTKITHVRITSEVRCAIWMSAKNQNKRQAVKLLEHEIRKCVYHTFDGYSKCSKDLCKINEVTDVNCSEAINDEDLEIEENDDIIMEHQIKYWTEWLSQEEARDGSNIGLDKDMLLDTNIRLNHVASKSEWLLYNNTTNIAESWLHIRSKFKDGKV